jgi:hypothetical protein
MTWERKIRRIMCGPTYENGHWRRKINLLIYSNYKCPDILTLIKVCLLGVPMQMICRLHWFGYVQRMEENRIPKKSIIYDLENNKPER